LVVAAFTGIIFFFPIFFFLLFIYTPHIGKAAVHVKGRTLHSALDISRFFDNGSKGKGKKALSAEAVRALQERWQPVCYLLIDEISTVSELLFAEVSTQMTMAKNPADKTLPFGGVNIIVCGDFMQFPPVTLQGVRILFIL
jgi:hypothetical protein